jgi:hypothetical protein
MRFQLEFMLLLEPKLQKAGPKRSPSVVSFVKRLRRFGDKG